MNSYNQKRGDILNYEEKLQSIENVCNNKARLQKLDLEQKLKDKIGKSIQEEMDKYRSKQEDRKKNTLYKMEKQYNTNLWQLENEYKQKYIELRTSINNRLREELKIELQNYAKSEQYLNYLRKNINNALNSIEDKQNIIIYLTSQDRQRLSQEFTNIEVMDDKYIGGCIVKGDSQIINNTILENLEEKIDEYKNYI